MLASVRDRVFAFIKKFASMGESGSTDTHPMRDALFMMPTPHPFDALRTLRRLCLAHPLSVKVASMSVKICNVDYKII